MITEHPYGPQLDLIDGRIDHFPEVVEKHREFYLAPNWYIGGPVSLIVPDVRLEISQLENISKGKVKRPELTASFMQTAGWEIVDHEEPVVRFWGTVTTERLGARVPARIHSQIPRGDRIAPTC